jgi:acyl carrier protein
MEDINKLAETLKGQIIKALNLEDMNPSDINTDAPLFIEGLGLDSIDALELMVLLEKNYGLKIETAQEGKMIFHSVRTIAEYILNHKK